MVKRNRPTADRARSSVPQTQAQQGSWRVENAVKPQRQGSTELIRTNYSVASRGIHVSFGFCIRQSEFPHSVMFDEVVSWVWWRHVVGGPCGGAMWWRAILNSGEPC